MKAKHKAMLAELKALYTRSEIEKQLDDMPKAGRPEDPASMKLLKSFAAWVLIESKRDGTDLSVAKAKQLASQHPAAFQSGSEKRPRKASASLLEKLHRKFEREKRRELGAAGFADWRKAVLAKLKPHI